MFGRFFRRKKTAAEFDFSDNEDLVSGYGEEEESAGTGVRGACDDGEVNCGYRCETINMVPFEWARPVVTEAISKKVNGEVFKRIFLYAVFFLLCAGVFGGISYYEGLKKKNLNERVNTAASTLSEYEAVAENLSVYKTYIEIPNNPSVYTQFYGVSFLAVRNGFLVGKLSYASEISGEASLRVNRDGFALETGKRLEDINVRGVWTLAGTVSPRAGTVMDSNWSMNFSKQVSVLFGRQGLNAYTRVTAAGTGAGTGRGGSSSDMVVTILLWK